MKNMQIDRLRACNPLSQKARIQQIQPSIFPHFPMKFNSALFFALSFALFSAPHVPGQLVDGPTSATLAVQADELDSRGNLVTARGNVRLQKGSQSLRADVITYNVVTEQAHARGNVVFVNDGQVWEGEELRYNFITGTGDFPDLTLTYDPFRIKADKAERVSPIQSRMEGVTLTTCDDLENPEFMIKASALDVYEETLFALRHPVFYLRGIPFFYLPRLVLDQERQATNIDFLPGYSNRDGLFALTGYNRYPHPGYRTKTHLDLRSERGVAVGQDFFWYNPETNQTTTSVRGYYANDQAPYRNDNEEERFRARGVEIDENRYRLNFFHRTDFTPTDNLRVKAALLSDPRIVQDFFEDEFRLEPVPENRATYSAIGDGWTANVELGKQINSDDFGGVNRMPEAVFSIPRRQLFDELELLYESETRAGYLERSFSKFERDEQNREEYSSARFHTRQMVFYPTRQFGWLHVVPRAGFGYTYYGETRDQETQITTESVVDEDTGVISTLFQTNTVDTAGSAEGRFLPEVGLETSFKAFSIWHNEPTRMGRGLRHVAEPFANYTIVPESDLTPDRTLQFDSIDRQGEQHNVRFGIRNKFQTKRMLPGGRHRIHDLANISVSTVYDLRDDVDRNLGNILLDTELRLVDWMRVRFDTQYNPDESEIETFNTELRVEHPENKSSLALNQRYRTDSNHTVQLSYDLNPRGRIGLEGYSRFELEDEGLEDQSLLLRYETDCVGYGLGVRWIAGDRNDNGADGEDEYRVWVQFWLTAFPRAIVDLGGR